MPHMNRIHHAQYRRRLLASGISDDQGNPTELAYFLDELYGPCLQDVEFFCGQSNLFRMIAAGKVVWEIQKHFPAIKTRVVSALAALIAKGSIHRRKSPEDMRPFFQRRDTLSDLLDEATMLIHASEQINSVPDGQKSAALSGLRIDPHQFRIVRAEWARIFSTLKGDDPVDYRVVGNHAVPLRCAILAGTHWINTFDRYGVLQDLSICSVLYERSVDIQAYDPNDLAVVGWNFPMSVMDQEWDMTSEGYPLTLVTRAEMERHAPHLLELPFVKKQFAGFQRPSE